MSLSQTAQITDYANDYQISMEPSVKQFRVSVGDTIIADSEQIKVLYETRLPPVFYFPKEDINLSLLRKSTTVTHCPFKGNASHWHLQAGEKLVKDIAWSYETPLPEVHYIKDHIAFYSNKVDPLSVDEERFVTEQESVEDEHPNPLVNWLLKDAWNATSPEELVRQFSRCMVNAGYPISRFFITIRLLHPLLRGNGYIWTRQDDQVQINEVPHEMMQEDQFLKSPLHTIFEGAGGIRRQLEGQEPVLDYPILEDLKREGATDYVAMPMKFSNGQVNAFSLASDQPGGFSTQQLGQLYEIMPLLSRLFEMFSSKTISRTLLDTYLGTFTGQRVLEGKIKRGDGENINAIIWFCDLRESTPLADSMSRPEFLGVLNRFFDGVAGVVLENGGEILRFIGDAALAIFPIGQRSLECQECGEQQQILKAGNQAIRAALQAQENMQAINAERSNKGCIPLKFGLGLHLGEVTYGNIGTASRLEFTVIGAAANEAARIEAMCKTLDQQILVSAALAQHFPDRFQSLGTYKLRGVEEEQELFVLNS